ncbi:SDR family oxidoreductase [Nocardioides sp. GY 10127]|uniref:SDR family oxidoreductase n=1 Tax=Nocardioides sp. GY 10127 TaxID=2569762 RepID=UPI0010A7DF34|nr:SDR family oxidoreductase [Nocardioides sp. GY 10127]TIC86477.1 SDR family oxidoreductase [Nocardioides sp. GY 10127]
MTSIAIVGGHGKVAQQLIPLLAERGDTPVALVRREEYRSELEDLGAQVRLLDIENSDAGDFAAAFEGCSAVVFAAGGGPDGSIERKRTVDLEGSLKSIAGAEKAGIDRFVQVSAIGADNPLPEDTKPVWRAYVEAKRDADAALRASDLAWTILRPATLTDDAPTGRVLLAETVERGSISRSDVAAVLAALLADPSTAGVQVELVDGPHTVAEALAGLAR